MNKKFSTLVATLLLSGALFTLNAAPVEDLTKVDGIELVQQNGKVKTITFTKDVTLTGKEYILVEEDNVVVDGQGKFKLNGHIVITGENCTVKGLTINFTNPFNGTEHNDTDGNGSQPRNRGAIVVNANMVTITNNVITAKVGESSANLKADGIILLPTAAKVDYKITGNKITATTIANAESPAPEGAAGIALWENLTLEGDKVSKTVKLKSAPSFDLKQIVDCAVDYSHVIYKGYNDDAADLGMPVVEAVVTPNETNAKAFQDIVKRSNKDSNVTFNGTAVELAEALGEQALGEVVITTSEGQVNKLDKYATIFNSDKKYYTVQTEKGFLSAATTAGKAVYVENGTIRHEILWSFGFEGDSYAKGKKSKLQNAESGVSFELPVLASENVLVVADKANTYVVDGVEYTVTPVDMVEQTVSYLTIDDEDLRHEVYRLGIYSPVWGGVSYFTENHGKPSHVIGLDPNALENGNVSEWTFALKSTVKVDRNYFWYDETKDANDKAKGWTKGTVKFEIPVYTLTNQYEETLGWNKDEKKYGAKESAIGFIFKKVGDYYNMVEVGTEAKPTSLFANSDSKVFGAHSADLGFLDKTNLYNPVQNDLVYISDPDLSYDYRHLTAEEKFVTFSELNIPTNKLSEEGKFLISGDKCQDVDAIKMLAHTVWEPKKESGLAQYLLALDTKEVMGDTIWCNASSTHKHATLKDSLNCVHTMVSRDSLFGRFLVCYVDSAKAFADNSDYHRPGDANEYVNNGLFRLGFVEGVHIHGVEKEAGKLVGKNELIIKNPEGRLSTADKAFNQAKFAFKYVEPVASVNEDAPFVIETAYFNAADYKMNGTGFLRNINGVVVVTPDQADATVFTLNPEEGGSTANEEIATSEVTVIAGEGQLTIAGAAGKKVVVSNILGQVVANTVLSSDNATIAAPQGVVVVAVEGEEAVKAIVK